MILINFSHPLTKEHILQVETLTSQSIDQVIVLPVQFDNRQPFFQQLTSLMEALPLSVDSLQTEPILVNPPSLNFITGVVLAELHGRMGYFPPILRTRSIEDSLPPRYEVAEVINLQSVRDKARKTRYGRGT